MMIHSLALLCLVAAIAGSCRPATIATPRFLNETAKEDLDKAVVVVLGRVESISDTARRRGPAGFRPIKVNLSVQRVLKGSVDSERICVVYFYPYGGYDGPGLVWIERGETGIVTLTQDSDCFRAVNDRRAIIPTHGRVPNISGPLDAVVAEATLPSKGGCRGNANQVSSELWSISIPLIGSRGTWRLLESEINSSDAAERACSCIVMSQVWKVNEPCLGNLPDSVMDGPQIDTTKATNHILLNREKGWFRVSPPDWLRTIVEGWGMDGAALRLHELLSLGVLRMTNSACSLLLRTVQSGRTDDFLVAAKTNEAAERIARTDVIQWLESGCPTTPGGLKPLSGTQ